MTVRPPLLAAALLASATSLAGQASGESPVGALGDLVPAHHALRSFDGAVSWYEFQPPPVVRYEQPDFEAWVARLEPIAVNPQASRFTAVWRDDDGAIRFVLSRGDRGTRIFAIAGAVIEFEDPGFHTQVGVARWGWEYQEGLLRVHRTWRLSLGPPGTDRPIGPPAPTALFAVTTYAYRKGATVPHRSRTYWSEEDRRAGRWGQKTSYRPDGTIERVKHNPERPYPY